MTEKDVIKSISKQVNAEVKPIAKKEIEMAQNVSQRDEKIKRKEIIDLALLSTSLGDYECYVGIPFETSGRGSEKLNNAELAYIHTHGVLDKESRQEIQTTMNELHYGYGEARKLYELSHGDPMYNIPPRPIIEPALEAHSEEISTMLSSVLQSLLEGNAEKAERKLKAAGIQSQNFVRNWFHDTRNGWPKNAPSTIEAWKRKHNIKSSSVVKNPLIDCGELLNSITYVISTPKLKKFTKRNKTMIGESQKDYELWREVE